MESDIVQSVVRLTEDSEESAPPSVEASPCKSPDVIESPDVIVEEEITEDAAKINIDHPLFVKVSLFHSIVDRTINGTVLYFPSHVQSTPVSVNTGKVNTLPYLNTSQDTKLREKVNSDKIWIPENSNHNVFQTKCLHVQIKHD